MSLLELEQRFSPNHLGFEVPAVVIAEQMSVVEGDAYLRQRAREEILVGRAAMFVALRSPDITAAVLDAEWGKGTRDGLLHDLSDEEALALRIFMGHSNADTAELTAREVFSREMPTELEMTQV